MEQRLTLIEIAILIICAVQLFLIVAYLVRCVKDWNEDDDKKGGGRDDI